jgi:hypothetical protein
MAEVSRELERSKIEVQLKLFSEQMMYQREKDRRLYENAVTVNENARLAIQKQGEVVSCLAHLSSVLSKGLSMPRDSHGNGRPQAPAPMTTAEATLAEEPRGTPYTSPPPETATTFENID